jgi:chromate reductase, NAD(P)H dehydrogenase (quinone)
MRILGISGSLRGGSHNTGLIRTAEALAPGDVELWDGLEAVPPYDEDDEANPAPAVVELRSALAGADGFLFATPEYNHSVPGHLKNALDWASRPLATNPIRNKPAAVVGASTGAFGAVWAQAELRKVLAAIGARVLEGDLPVGLAAARFGDDGLLEDRELRARLAAIVGDLIAAVDERLAAAA